MSNSSIVRCVLGFCFILIILILCNSIKIYCKSTQHEHYSDILSQHFWMHRIHISFLFLWFLLAHLWKYWPIQNLHSKNRSLCAPQLHFFSKMVHERPSFDLLYCRNRQGQIYPHICHSASILRLLCLYWFDDFVMVFDIGMIISYA